jgi:hypothetical protein
MLVAVSPWRTERGITNARPMADAITVRDHHRSNGRVTTRSRVNSTVAPRGHPAGIRAARGAEHGKVTAGNNPNFM